MTPVPSQEATAALLCLLFQRRRHSVSIIQALLRASIFLLSQFRLTRPSSPPCLKPCLPLLLLNPGRFGPLLRLRMHHEPNASAVARCDSRLMRLPPPPNALLPALTKSACSNVRSAGSRNRRSARGTSSAI